MRQRTYTYYEMKTIFKYMLAYFIPVVCIVTLIVEHIGYWFFTGRFF